MARDRPWAWPGGHRHLAETGVGVDEASVRGDHGQVKLGRAWPEQEQVARLGIALSILEAGVGGAV